MIRKTKGLLATVIMGLISFLFVIADYLALHDIWHGENDLSQEWSIITLSFIGFVLFHTLFAIFVVFPYFNPRKSAGTEKADKRK
jgi:fumarate reductase subunit D